MATVSAEKRMSMAMRKVMDSLSFNPQLVILDFMRDDDLMQNRMMDLMMGFMSTWSENYKAGMTRPGEIMHRLGEMSTIMLASLTAEQSGRHAPRPRRKLP